MNDLLALMSPPRWAILAVLALALLATMIGYGELRAHQAEVSTTNRYEAALGRQKTEAAVLLGRETANTIRLEAQLKLIESKLETVYEQRKNESKAAELRLAAAAAGGRLRDPNAAGCGSGGGGAKTEDVASSQSGAGDRSEAGGLLSEQLSGLLKRLQREADTINDAYAVCRADAIATRKAFSADPD